MMPHKNKLTFFPFLEYNDIGSISVHRERGNTEMDKIRKLLLDMKAHPRIKELISRLKTPENDEEAIEGYLSVAQALNMDVTKEELAESFAAATEAQKAKTEEAAERVNLDAKDAESVAGGYKCEKCEDTYETEGEWCWFTDSCSVLITDYEHYSYDPQGARDSFWDPQEGEENYCENLAQYN